MANQIMNTTNCAAIIPEIWSASFFQVLKDRLPYIDSVDRSYQGDIQAMGDIVNIASIPEFDEATLLSEGAQADADAVTLTSQQLTINSRAVKDVIITKKAQLESLTFMDELRDKMIFSINKKIQADIITNIVPSASAPDHQISYDSGTTLALADILEAKELLDAANVAEDNRIAVLGSAQYNDIFNITSFMSRDYIPSGSPITAGSIAAPVAGFAVKMTNVVSSTARFFHPSFLTIAIQQALNISLFDEGINGLRASRLNMDILYGIKQMDNKRVVSIS